MKHALLTFGITAFRLVLSFIYFFLKLLPMRNRICFLSRQSNHVRYDFIVVSKAIKKRKDVECVFLCKRLEGIKSIPSYITYMFKCIYNLAVSKVCVIDTYSIPVSLLKHREELTIIQIWHALGAIKKFGLQSVGLRGGRDAYISHLMRMHQNYDYVLCAGEKTKHVYSQAFGIDENKIILTGVPRIDYLLNSNTEKKKNKIYEKYPELREKKVIFYVPTFRSGEIPDISTCADIIDKDKYILIVRLHPSDEIKLKNSGKYESSFSDLSTLKLLTVADYVITDYSAVSIEAAILGKAVFFYLYDIKQYIDERGLNFNPLEEMPHCSAVDFDSIYKYIDSGVYDYKKLADFRREFVSTYDTNNVERITDFILKNMGDTRL